MRKLLFLILFPIIPFFVFGQKITVNGYIYERGSLETLPGTLIYEPQSQSAVTANTYGFYTITLPYRDSLFVVFSSFGYVNDTLWLKTNESIEYDVRLSKIKMLEAVNISTEKRNTEQVQMSTLKLSPKEIKSVPMLFGEKDEKKDDAKEEKKGGKKDEKKEEKDLKTIASIV